MDYGFATGTTGYDYRMRLLLRVRHNTELVWRRSDTNIAAFINFLDTSDIIPKPIGNILIGSHGNDEGWLQIDLDGGASTDIDYEVLENAITSGSVVIPNSLREQPDGTLVPIDIHIRGCQIGKSLKFMLKLKEAFDGVNRVTAPKHFHIIDIAQSRGIFEYLGYGFKIIRKERLLTKPQARTSFQEGVFRFINESDVPDNRWKSWIPRRKRLNKPKTITKRFYVKLGQTIGSQTDLRVKREFRHKRRKFHFFPISIVLSSNPPNENARMGKLRNFLANHDLFKSGHDYPIYERYGYSDLNDFLNAWKWRFIWRASTKKLICLGWWHEYTVIVPITDPNNNNLIYNFYPFSGTGFNAITNLQVTDTQMFQTV